MDWRVCDIYMCVQLFWIMCRKIIFVWKHMNMYNVCIGCLKSNTAALTVQTCICAIFWPPSDIMQVCVTVRASSDGKNLLISTSSFEAAVKWLLSNSRSPPLWCVYSHQGFFLTLFFFLLDLISMSQQDQQDESESCLCTSSSFSMTFNLSLNLVIICIDKITHKMLLMIYTCVFKASNTCFQCAMTESLTWEFFFFFISFERLFKRDLVNFLWW